MKDDTPIDGTAETFSSMFGKYADAVASKAADEEIERKAMQLVPFFEKKAKALLRGMRYGSDDHHWRRDRLYHDRQDVMQSVFARLVNRKNAPGIWDKAKRERWSNLNAYLAVALRNGMISVSRCETAHHKKIRLEQPFVHDAAPEDEFIQLKLEDRLRTAIGMHTVDSLETYLRYLHNHNYEETANHQGIKTATARKRVSRVRDTLRPVLTKRNLIVNSFRLETLSHIIAETIVKKIEANLLVNHQPNAVRVHGTNRYFRDSRNSDISH
jgi:RNA polymerase sigma factor (sigma-70 family)